MLSLRGPTFKKNIFECWIRRNDGLDYSSLILWAFHANGKKINRVSSIGLGFLIQRSGYDAGT